MHHLAHHFASGLRPGDAADLSSLASGLTLSPILTIAGRVRARGAAGYPVADFTVGDFAPSQFRPPSQLTEQLVAAARAGHTHYPPAPGLPILRDAIREHYARTLGLDYPRDSIVVTTGARPAIYATYRCLVEPGDVVVAPAPHWHNAAYCHHLGARLHAVPGEPEDGFMPHPSRLAPALRTARLLVLNSPANPTGTMLRRDRLKEICRLVLDENRRRRAAGERRLYVLYDQVYRLLTFGGVEHVTPVGLMPEMAPYTLMCDAISKCFAATGLRVGWLVGPPDIIARALILLADIGAWAPHPEQHAAAAALAPDSGVQAWLDGFCGGLAARLDRLYSACERWRCEGLPIRAIEPQGAMYLSMGLELGERPQLADEEAALTWLLHEAGCGVLPFSTFGDHRNAGWFRLSVGAVDMGTIDACLGRLKSALEAIA